MLVDLIKKHGPSVQTACLGVMQNLSSNSAFHRKLLEQGVLEALDAAKDVDGGAMGSQCAAVLYNFSLEEKSLTQMMELGAIFLVTHLSYSHVMKVRFILHMCHFNRKIVNAQKASRSECLRFHFPLVCEAFQRTLIRLPSSDGCLGWTGAAPVVFRVRWKNGQYWPHFCWKL